MGEYFGPDRRLRKHREFSLAQRQGQRVRTSHFVMLVAGRPGGDSAGPSRLGLVVAKSVGGAVRRNRVKRLCRECFRKWPDLLPRGVDLVVVARPGADELGLNGVLGEWRSIERPLRKRAAEALARGPRTDHPAAATSKES